MLKSLLRLKLLTPSSTLDTTTRARKTPEHAYDTQEKKAFPLGLRVAREVGVQSALAAGLYAARIAASVHAGGLPAATLDAGLPAARLDVGLPAAAALRHIVREIWGQGNRCR